MNRRGFDGKTLSPWYFPSAEAYTQLLQANGFHVHSAVIVPRPTQLDTDMAGWLKTFAFSFLQALSTDQERQDLIAEIVEHLRPAYQREDGKWFVMYQRLRVIAFKN